jgi:hypothetical protein
MNTVTKEKVPLFSYRVVVQQEMNPINVRLHYLALVNVFFLVMRFHGVKEEKYFLLALGAW